MQQQALFSNFSIGPEGFRYQPDFITPEEERMLLKEFKRVPLHIWNYKGYDSKRRVKSYTEESGYPAPLIPILERVARFAGVTVDGIVHTMISEYSPGTAIGWHRDNGYEKIMGISLGSAVSFRLRKLPSRYDKNSDKRKWERITITAEPRSIYIMDGESRSRWQHSIPPVGDWRWSITMRTVEKVIKY